MPVITAYRTIVEARTSARTRGVIWTARPWTQDQLLYRFSSTPVPVQVPDGTRLDYHAAQTMLIHPSVERPVSLGEAIRVGLARLAPTPSAAT